MFQKGSYDFELQLVAYMATESAAENQRKTTGEENAKEEILQPIINNNASKP